jgi:hypothetical protein
MSTTLPRARRSATPLGQGRRTRARNTHDLSASHAPARVHSAGGEPMGSYVDEDGRLREIIRCDGAAGSRLVIDRDRLTCGDRRLLAHLAADEPLENARLICGMYLRESPLRRCRRVIAHDLCKPPRTEAQGQIEEAADCEGRDGDQALRDSAGNRYCLSQVRSRSAIQLRWCKLDERGENEQLVSVRDVVGAIESYEPIRSLTALAVARHPQDGAISTATLKVELERLGASRVVLNRGLREFVLAAVERSDLSMSEIALRCGRVKRDRRGALSGETTWLARRIGLAACGGASTPSPWVHSDVLALIARKGLGVAPLEVELA